MRQSKNCFLLLVSLLLILFPAAGRAENFVVLPEKSEVGYDAASTVGPFTGRTNHVEGTFRFKPEAIGKGMNGYARVEAATLNSGLAHRDNLMQEHMESDTYPFITFRLDEISELEMEGDTYLLLFTGSLTVHGVTREISLPVSLVQQETEAYRLSGRHQINLADYNIEQPTAFFGLVKMHEELVFWLDLYLLPEEKRKNNTNSTKE